MKTILLPTDFSKNSMNAINYAMCLFKNVTCKFYILNVHKASSFITDDMVVASASVTIYQTIIDAAKISIENLIADIEKKYENKKHTFQGIVDYDDFTDSINQNASINHIDLIVMGTKGASGLEKVLFGSNTVKVMQRCYAPVLAIPDGYKFKAWDVVAFTSSFKALYDPSDLRPLITLAKSTQSKLCVLHIADNTTLPIEIDKNIDFFNKHFKDVEYQYIEDSEGDICNRIENHINTNNINLIAMMNKKHSFFERLFSTRTIENIAFHITIPFLVMHESGVGETPKH
ncbi:universal stress protein [Mariniflexile ostreae]|uniref:Universal stress protein n=1 Tax=Mariniflexile ostreae TaxID=1520892 RepID=A0ABV5FBE8_9FLAO